MQSRIFAATAIISALGISAAMATDLPVKAPYVKAPIVPPVFNWAGWYIGINGGYGWGDPSVIVDPAAVPMTLPAGSTTVTTGAPFTLSTKPKGGLVGGQLGYNWQLDRVVIGAELDFDYAHLKDSASGTFSNSNQFPDPNQENATITITQTGTATLESRVDWIGTLRGRLGYAFDRVLPYVTGGAAVAQMKSTVSISTFTNDNTGTFTATSATVKDTLWGYAVGGGLDVAIDPRWVLRAEYLFLGFEKKDHGTAVPGVTSFENGMNVQTVRAALSYRF